MAAITLDTIRILLYDIRCIKDAPEDIINIETELCNVQLVIDSFQAALEVDDWKPEIRNIIQARTVEAALTACNESCTRFRSEFQKLLKHSIDGKISKRDRFSFEFMSKGKVVAFKTELNMCKSTVGLALNAANYMVATEQYKQLRVMVKEEQNGTQQRSTDTDAAEQNTIDAVLESDVQRGVQLLDGYQELLALVQSKVHENRAKVEVGDIVQENSKVISGIMNADEKSGALDIKIGNVKATTGSKGIIGYAKGVDLNAFFA